MPSLRRHGSAAAPPEGPAPASAHLPLRWVVILLATTGAGFAVGAVAEPAAGVMAAVAVLATLNRITR